MRLISSKVVVWAMAAGAALAALPAWAEPRIGIVDAPRLMEESPQGKAVSEAMRSEFAPRQRTLQAQEQALKAKVDKLQKDGATMTEEQRARAEKDLRDGQRDFERARGEFQDDVSARRTEELSRLQRTLGERGDDPLGGRPLGAQPGHEADLAQRPRRLGAAGDRPDPAERAAKGRFQTGPVGKTAQAAQPLAGHQHEIVGRCLDKAPQPGQHRRLVGSVGDRHQRTAHGLGAVGLEHLPEPVEFAMFEDGDPSAGERAPAHRISLCHGA